MSDLTLTEFLLARIAEREQGAKVDLKVAQGPNSMTARNARWDLADCEAKRRIVEDWQSLAAGLDAQGRPRHLFDPITSMLLKATLSWLCLLALPYAEHPEYRDEWRP